MDSIPEYKIDEAFNAIGVLQAATQATADDDSVNDLSDCFAALRKVKARNDARRMVPIVPDALPPDFS